MSGIPESGTFVKFWQVEPPITTAFARIDYIIPIYQPDSFENYQADAKNLVLVLKGEREGDLSAVAEAGLNDIGLQNLLVALAYEILEDGP